MSSSLASPGPVSADSDYQQRSIASFEACFDTSPQVCRTAFVLSSARSLAALDGMPASSNSEDAHPPRRAESPASPSTTKSLERYEESLKLVASMIALIHPGDNLSIGRCKQIHSLLLDNKLYIVSSPRLFSPAITLVSPHTPLTPSHVTLPPFPAASLPRRRARALCGGQSHCI